MSRSHAWSDSATCALGKGGILILYAIRDGNTRPSEITDAAGIIHPTLDRKINQLQLAGFLGRRKLPEANKRDWLEQYLLRLGLEATKFFETIETEIRGAAFQAATKSQGLLNQFQVQKPYRQREDARE